MASTSSIKILFPLFFLASVLLTTVPTSLADVLDTEISISQNTISKLKGLRSGASSQSSSNFAAATVAEEVLRMPSKQGDVFLKLVPFEIRAENYRSVVSTDSGTHDAPFEIDLFQGQAFADEAGEIPLNSYSRFAVIKDSLTGEESLHGLYNVNGTNYEAVSTSPTTLRVADPSAFVQGQLEEFGCGTEHGERVSLPQPYAPSSGVLAASGEFKEIEIATEADYEMVQLLGSAAGANAEILLVLSYVDAIYRSQLGLTLKVVFQNAWDTVNDPYISASANSQFLGEFQSYWNMNFAQVVSYDIGHMFTARGESVGGVSGLAYLGGGCGLGRYGWTEFNNGQGPLTIGDFLYTTAHVASHEIGHNLNAVHDDPCGTSAQDSYIMCNSTSQSNFIFSSLSLNDISQFVSSGQAFCLADVSSTGAPNAPFLIPFDPVSTKIVEEGDSNYLGFGFGVIDPDGHDPAQMTVSVSPFPAGGTAAMSPFTANLAFFEHPHPLGTVDGCTDGPFKQWDMTFTVTDPTSLSGSANITAIVRNQNTAPVLSSISGATVNGGDTVSRTLSASDVDCDPLLYSLKSGNPLHLTSFNPDTGELVFTAPQCAEQQTYNFEFEAIDANGGSSNVQTLSVTVNASGGAGSCNSTKDSDGDGVSDSQEALDGSNPNDRGSFQTRITSPTYTLWNGFLGMTNILELVNVGSGATNVTVKLFRIDGSLGSQIVVPIQPQEQRDLIVNDMTGFSENSFGVITVEFTGEIDGRLFYYRDTGGFSSFEFAFGVPFQNPNFGKTAAAFNTFQPSLHAKEPFYQVANFLSLVNLANSSKTYTVMKYNQQGKLLTSTKYTLANFQRQDIEAGHEIPGASNVGLIVVVPHDPSAPYLAQLFRYGANSPGAFPVASYSFAFPLVAKIPNGETLYSPISTRFSGQTWLEVVNVSGQTVTVNVQYLNASGASIGSETPELAPYSQRHLDTSSILGAEETGIAVLTPSAPNSVVAQSMFYLRDAGGSVDAMYGVQAREALGDPVRGSYNLFLGMEDYLRLFNTSSFQQSVNLTLQTFSGGSVNTLYSQGITLPANGSTEIPLHQSATYNTSADTYGVVSLDPASSGVAFGDIIRVKKNGEELSFVAPTEVR